MAEDEKTENDETPVEQAVEAVEPLAEAEDAADTPEASATPVDEPAEAVVEETTAAEVVAEATETDAETAEEPGEETIEAAAPASPVKKKRKRLPRAQRPGRPKPKRAVSGERKPIVRLEKPEGERGRRQERQGTVVSSAMDKTIVVRVDVVKAHPRYKKVVRRSVKFHAHDERNEASVGDVVRIVETRPLSATKRWRLTEIVEAAK
jgi:small subunit ribosomal protein S17